MHFGFHFFSRSILQYCNTLFLNITSKTKYEDYMNLRILNCSVLLKAEHIFFDKDGTIEPCFYY